MVPLVMMVTIWAGLEQYLVSFYGSLSYGGDSSHVRDFAQGALG